VTKLGFRATDGDDESTLQVVDGSVSSAGLTPEQHCDLFADLCTKLRALGATEVRAERFRARFDAQPAAQPAAQNTAAPGVVVTRVQLGPRPKAPEEALTVHEGEQLSEADKERRRRYRDIAGAQ
jgi:hypothetical protein